MKEPIQVTSLFSYKVYLFLYVYKVLLFCNVQNDFVFYIISVDLNDYQLVKGEGGETANIYTVDHSYNWHIHGKECSASTSQSPSIDRHVIELWLFPIFPIVLVIIYQQYVY